jgi:hypothetical protein
MWAIVSAVVVTGIGLMAKSVAKAHQQKIQYQRDRFPLQEVEFLKSFGSNPPPRDFRLFLRSFDTLGKLMVNNPNFSRSFSQQTAQPELLDFEFIIAQYLKVGFQSNVYAIGRTGSGFGPGTLHVPNSEWISNFELLAKASYSILVVPGSTAGSIWEIRWLKANFLLVKTVFIMPNSNCFREFNGERYWDRVTRATSRIGIEMPVWEPRGGIFKLNNLGCLQISEPLNLKEPDKFINSVLRAEEPY